jgi:hypothetical protein
MIAESQFLFRCYSDPGFMPDRWGSSPPGSSRRAGGYSSVLRLTADEVSLPYSPVPKSSSSGTRTWAKRMRYGKDIALLPEAWLRLLSCEAQKSAVILNDESPRAPVLYLGITAFVRDDFVREIKTAPCSGWLRRWRGELSRATLRSFRPGTPRSKLPGRDEPAVLGRLDPSGI